MKVLHHSRGGPVKTLLGVAAGALAGLGSAAAVIRGGAFTREVPREEESQRAEDTGDKVVGAFDRDAAGIDEPKEEKGVRESS